MIKVTTSDMNTPEYATKYSNKQELQNQIRPIQGRDYGRILREYNTPAQWYKPSPITRSVYYYDQNYQKYLQQQQLKSLNNVHFLPPPIRVPNQPKSRIKYTSNSHHFSNHHQQKQMLPSRLQSVPILPPIITHKKPNNE